MKLLPKYWHSSKFKKLQPLKLVITLNSAITTEKKLMNAVANISGLERLADLPKTNIWNIYQDPVYISKMK